MKKRKPALIAAFALFFAGMYFLFKTAPSKDITLERVTSAPQVEPTAEVKSSSEPAPLNPTQAQNKPAPPKGLSPIQKEFQDTAAEVLQSFPTLEDLHKLSDEELHFTPPQLLQAGMEIGKILDLVEKHPELKEQGIQFFDTCLKTQNYPNTIRSLCYSHLREMDPERYPKGSSDPQIPEEVRHLADLLE